jgi:hypothetical protein
MQNEFARYPYSPLFEKMSIHHDEKIRYGIWLSYIGRDMFPCSVCRYFCP